ncbi:hypothetical protein B0H15DRAFT_764899, partial [Mycena belliarum]
ALCSFCDRPLPRVPSARLVELREELEGKSRPCPVPGNPGHREASMVHFSTYCELHRIECEIFPIAIAREWPFDPDFTTLFDRVIGLKSALTTICEEPEDSSFFRAAKDFYTPKPWPTLPGSEPRQLPSSTQLQSIYGETGYQIMTVAVRFMFPDVLDLAPFKPLVYDTLVREVLMPEAARRIVQEDLKLTLFAAKNTLKDSHLFGSVQHPASDD